MRKKDKKSPESGLRKKPGIIRRALAQIRRSFLTGLVVAAPIGVTAYLVVWFVSGVDGWFDSLFPAAYNPRQYIPFDVPGLGFFISIIALTILGALTANFFGRYLLAIGERIVARMPIVRGLYTLIKQVFETVLMQKESLFTQAALIEYPRKGSYALVFITSKLSGEISRKISQADKNISADEVVGVFLPTTPNPTSGFFLMLKRSEVIPLKMSAEDAAKVIISAGLIIPEETLPSAPRQIRAAVAKRKSAKRKSARKR